MLRISKKMFYAVDAVLYIAYNTKTDPISSKDIAARQGLPPRYLEQIMQKLVRAGILRGVRGPRGGYVLAKERRKVSVAEICDVIKQMDSLDVDALEQTNIGGKIVYPLCKELEESLQERLESLTMAVMCEQASDLKIKSQRDDHNDFSI